MGKQNKRINFNKLLTVGFACIVFALWGNACLHAEDLPEGMAPLQSSDPAVAAQEERAQFVKEIRRVENLNRKYTKQIDEIKDLLAEKDADFQQRMKELEEKMSRESDNQQKNTVAQEQFQQTAKELESKTNEMLSKGGDLDPDDQQFKDELAKAHYNMGNIYFERGEYQRAVVEYYQSVDLAPNDPDTHYNLAFVSSEYLGDQETSLKHYQWYLYLKPNADDTALVNEKILEAKLHLRSKVDSVLDKDNGHFNLTR